MKKAKLFIKVFKLMISNQETTMQDLREDTKRLVNIMNLQDKHIAKIKELSNKENFNTQDKIIINLL